VKAHGDLLRAAQRILRTERDARFLIVGDGPLRGELAATAARLGVDRACSFPGSRADVHDLVAAMDIFVLPSLHEGIPMALLEAMALERPVVATAVGGVPEVVTDRVSGLLVAPRDDRALADACLALARNVPWARTLGAAARRTVTDRFSHQANGEALVGVYRSVMGRRATPSVAIPGATPERTSGAELGAPALAWELATGLVRIAQRRAVRAIEGASERRRMNQVRQHPAPLTAALGSAGKILMVCHGNIIRSAFAARLVAQALADRPGLAVASAGLEAMAGRPAHPTALQLATTRSIDLSGHAASPVAAETVAESDVIFVMDIPQLVTITRRFPAARGKTFLLTCLAPDAPLEIGDPVDGDESRFQACFDHISQAARPIVGTLRATAITQ
jgi:protein-tyrosine-phosphatase